MTLKKLIEAAAYGNHGAKSAIYQLLSSQMLTLCERYLDGDDAIHAMNDGFIEFFLQLPVFKYKSEAETVSYIRRIMSNTCADKLKEQHLEVVIPVESAREISFEPSVYSKMHTTEIMRVIWMLPPGYRSVFNMYCIEGLSHSEIAECLGISEGTSHSQLKRAKIFLQDLNNKKKLGNEQRKQF